MKEKEDFKYLLGLTFVYCVMIIFFVITFYNCYNGVTAGPIGPKGPKNSKSSTGPTGPIGIQGNQGIRGPQGETGLTGPRGVNYLSTIGQSGIGIINFDIEGTTQYQFSILSFQYVVIKSTSQYIPIVTFLLFILYDESFDAGKTLTIYNNSAFNVKITSPSQNGNEYIDPYGNPLNITLRAKQYVVFFTIDNKTLYYNVNTTP